MQVYKLYIIDKAAGICVFDQTFVETQGKFSSDLVTGFLHAMQLFAEEMADQSIESIMLSQMAITFHVKGKLLYALTTDRETGSKDAVIIHAFLEGVASRFENKYQDLLDKGALNNTAVFESFARDVEEELGTRSTDVTYIETRAEKFRNHYETAVEDIRRFKDDILHEYSSLAMPVVRVVKDRIDGAMARTGHLFKFTRALLGSKNDRRDEKGRLPP